MFQLKIKSSKIPEEMPMFKFNDKKQQPFSL